MIILFKFRGSQQTNDIDGFSFEICSNTHESKRERKKRRERIWLRGEMKSIKI